MDIGKRIQKARKAANMTQAALGKELGVSGAMIGQWENNLRNPKPETLERIAEALEISLWELTPSTLRDAIKFGYEQGYWSRAEEFEEFGEAENITDVQPVLDFYFPDMSHKENKAFNDLASNYKKLNFEGMAEAAKRIEELTHIPKYQRLSPQRPLSDED